MHQNVLYIVYYIYTTVSLNIIVNACKRYVSNVQFVYNLVY